MKEFDERYNSVENAMFDAFFMLIDEKDMDKITVSDIIKKTGIVRSTFYNHYENIPAFIEAAEDKTINDIFSLMESFHPKNDKDVCKSYFLAIVNYAKNNPFVANLLESPRSDVFFEKMMTMFHKYVSNLTNTKVSFVNSKETFSYLIACTIGSTIGVLHKWIAEDFETPADTVADLLAQVFITGILPYL